MIRSDLTAENIKVNIMSNIVNSLITVLGAQARPLLDRKHFHYPDSFYRMKIRSFLAKILPKTSRNPWFLCKKSGGTLYRAWRPHWRIYLIYWYGGVDGYGVVHSLRGWGILGIFGVKFEEHCRSMCTEIEDIITFCAVLLLIKQHLQWWCHQFWCTCSPIAPLIMLILLKVLEGGNSSHYLPMRTLYNMMKNGDKLSQSD